MFTVLVGSVRGPLVGLRQRGLEQRLPALSARVSTVRLVKSSLMGLYSRPNPAKQQWSREGWRAGPARDAVLDDLAAAAASAHPEALRLLGDYVGGDAGITLTLLACDAGYDCAPDALWVVEYCQLSWTVCGIDADGREALLASLPPYEANEIGERVADLRGGTAAEFRRFLGAALAPDDGR